MTEPILKTFLSPRSLVIHAISITGLVLLGKKII